jgi:hypothetical protein
MVPTQAATADHAEIPTTMHSRLLHSEMAPGMTPGMTPEKTRGVVRTVMAMWLSARQRNWMKVDQKKAAAEIAVIGVTVVIAATDSIDATATVTVPSVEIDLIAVTGPIVVIGQASRRVRAKADQIKADQITAEPTKVDQRSGTAKAGIRAANVTAAAAVVIDRTKCHRNVTPLPIA